MPINIRVALEYALPRPTDLILQIEAANIPEQSVITANINAGDCEHFVRVAAQDDIGERIWIRQNGALNVVYSATVQIDRVLADLSTLPAVPPHRLPGETIPYLMDSHYVPASHFQNFVDDVFGEVQGGERIVAFRNWIANTLSYQSGSSDSRTNALDTFVERRGVCRDFAHLMIAFARASAIPARFASVYAPDVTPQDFHAVAEVFLADLGGDGGSWHLVDATGMAEPHEMAKIGIGRDAADVSILTLFGIGDMISQQVEVTRA